MDLTPYVDTLRSELLASAEHAPEDVRSAAERLARTLDPATRMVLLDALSQAAAEIATRVPSGSVDVRLRGREVDFVVDVPPPPAAEEGTAYAAPAAAGEEDEEAGDVVRLTLRLPEQVKVRAEELAGRTGRSLNSWIVSALRAATSGGGITVDLSGLADLPFGDHSRGSHRSGHRLSGWI